MSIYQGIRDRGGRCTVFRDGQKLDPRNDLFNHSPDGFEWGYGGSGPAQTALAILASHLEDDDRAVRLHQDFKFAVIAGLPRDRDWTLSSERVAEIVARLESERRR